VRYLSSSDGSSSDGCSLVGVISCASSLAASGGRAHWRLAVPFFLAHGRISSDLPLLSWRDGRWWRLPLIAARHAIRLRWDSGCGEAAYERGAPLRVRCVDAAAAWLLSGRLRSMKLAEAQRCWLLQPTSSRRTVVRRPRHP
jgi:hypothetical protein